MVNSKDRQASVVRMYMCQHFQTSSPQKPLGRLKPNFIWSLLGTGERKFVQTVLVTWPRWPPCPYMVKTLKVGMQHRALVFYRFCLIGDTGLTMTYFMARSNLVSYAFIGGKGKTIDFAETVVVYDLKLAKDDRSNKKFLLTSKLCPLGAVCPLPWATCIKSW